MIEAASTAAAPAAQVTRWVHEAAHGQIQGFDGAGRVVLVLAVGPQFAQRLASAFGALPGSAGAPLLEPDEPAARYTSPASMLASVASSQAKG